MYIVTGGAGFIGSAIVWGLNKKGIKDIIIVDNLACSEKWKNLVGLKYTKYIHRTKFIEMLKENALPWDNIKAIFHMGACSSTTEKDADFLMENNTAYTQYLIEYALKYDIRFVNASSAATYGDGSLGFSGCVENIPSLRPLNMYGYSKQLVDLWLLENKYEEKVVSLKFFNVYGPNEYHKDSMRSVICKSFENIKRSGKVQLFKSYKEEYTHGGQQRDFVYVKDCVDIMLWLTENKHVNGIFNIGTGVARSWNELANAVFSAMNTPVNIEYIDMPEMLQGKYQYYTQADMDWMGKVNCPIRFRSIEEGVKDYVQEYLAKDYAFLG